MSNRVIQETKKEPHVPREYTSYQRDAITQNRDDICVAAGAGSGKTGVLVERFVRLIVESKAGTLPESQRAGVENILVITFTEKATKEVKQRIVSQLNAHALLDERRQLETAYISTIHGFCSRLLQENPFEAGVDPVFQVLDSPQSRRLFRSSFERVLENAYAESDSEILDLVAVTQGRREQGEDTSDPLLSLVVAAESVLDRLRGAGRSLDEVEKHLLRGLEHTSQTSNRLVADWIAPIVLEIEIAFRGLQQFQEQLKGVHRQLFQALGGFLEPKSEIQDTIISLNEVLQSVGKVRNPHALPSSPESEIFQYLQRVRIACEQAKALYLVQAEHEEQAKIQGHRFWGLLVKTWRAYESVKRRQGVLDSDDLQGEAVRLLENAPDVRKRYREMFRHILVDEFQDTNLLQMRLIDLLHAPETQMRETTPNHLFLVGDVQQSIYGFRNADPTLFRDIERRFREEKEGLHIPLSVNFRSRPEILQLVRRVFGQIWREEKTPFVPLTQGAPFVDKATPSLEIVMTGGITRKEYVPMEAEALACRIEQIVEGRELVITSESDPRCGQPLEYRDIAVLLRATTQIDLYERAFAKRGLPYFVASAGKGYYTRHEVRDVMNMLTVLDTPLDDVALVAALRSPFVGVDLDTLYHLIRVSESRQKYPISLYRSLPDLVESRLLPPLEAQKLRLFLQVMEELRIQEDRLPVGHLLERLFRQTAYDARLLCRPGGRRRLANVRKLLQMANSEPVIGVREFILRLRDLQKVSEREGDAPTAEEEANVVRFFTIHGAKGLEFPLVVLADMSRPTTMPERRLFACDPQTLALGTRLGGQGDLAYNTLQERRQRADRKEAERVLYVAMTRAREHLLMFGNTTGSKESLGEAVFNILGLLEPPEASEVRTLAGNIVANVASTSHYAQETRSAQALPSSASITRYAEEVVQQLIREEENRIEENL